MCFADARAEARFARWRAPALARADRAHAALLVLLHAAGAAAVVAHGLAPLRGVGDLLAGAACRRAGACPVSVASPAQHDCSCSAWPGWHARRQL